MTRRAHLQARSALLRGASPGDARHMLRMPRLADLAIDALAQTPAILCLKCPLRSPHGECNGNGFFYLVSPSSLFDRPTQTPY